MKKQQHLYIGDNLPIMLGMESNSVDLIYTDPPFKSETFRKGKTEKHSFNDTWSDYQTDFDHAFALKIKYPHLWQMIMLSGKTHSPAMQYYLEFMTPRIVQIHRLLKQTGTLYLHCDMSAGHYLKLILDSVFGQKQFKNEIVWHYGAGHPPKKDFARKHDTIFRYTRGKNYVFNSSSPTMRVPFKDISTKMHFKNVDEDGRMYRQYQSGKISYLDEGKVVTSVWTDIDGQKATSPISPEYTGYSTQKPIALLDRIITASSNEGDLVLDPFCGCATACVAAAQLKRRWVGIDQNEEAIKILKHRFQDARFEYHTNKPVTHQSPKGIRSVADGKTPAASPLPKRKVTGYKKLNKQKAKLNLLQADYKNNKTPFCRGCGNKPDEKHLEVDHILPKSRGGLDELDNYQLLCGICNRRKGNKDMEYLYDVLDAETRQWRMTVLR